MGEALAMVASVALWPLLALTRWWLADLPVPDWRDMPEYPPCPHCGYFGGEEHHPACPVTERRARAWYARRGLTEPVPGTPEPLVLAALEVRHG